MKKIKGMNILSYLVLLLALIPSLKSYGAPLPQSDFDWESFLSQHDMCWTRLTSDPVAPSNDGGLVTGYYAGAIMGNGLLGTNLYKLKENVYRLNVGRSDVREIRQPYNLFNSARLPIGYFTISPAGKVVNEEMRLSLYDAMTSGHFKTDGGSLRFNTYVHALDNYIVFEGETSGNEKAYTIDFIPYKAISPRCYSNPAPKDYLNHEGQSNPQAVRRTVSGTHLLIQSLVTDTTMTEVGGVYVVAWREKNEGSKQRMIATVSWEKTEKEAVRSAIQTLNKAFRKRPDKLADTHKRWWNQFYKHAAFLTFPDTRLESFYWLQYYKFASTARPGKPIVDLQGVWPSWDTPWTAVWINLNLQLTYSWQTKANLGWLSEPLWNSLYEHRDNLRRNVTDIPSQAEWTDASCLGRTSSYDFLSPLDPQSVEKNQYEVGNLTWLLYYYWQYCVGYNETAQLTERLFPMLKSAINLYFHIRTNENGTYGLPATASPEYLGGNVGPNCNYDLASLRWGLQTLIDIDKTYHLNDPKLPEWEDFLEHLVDFPYDEKKGYKISDRYTFDNVSHRHYSHLFMIYPYYIVNWQNKADRDKIRLSVDRWKGNQGYSRTGKAAMLLSMNKGNEALKQIDVFLNRFVKPNTLYAETGPVIETPMAALSTIQDFYMQDWKNTIRVFYGIPDEWKEASFARMRAQGAFLVSAVRSEGKTVYIRLTSEAGNHCRLQTDIPLDRLVVSTKGHKVDYRIVDASEGVIEFNTKKGQTVELADRTLPVKQPRPLHHPENEKNFYGDKKVLKH